MKPQPRRPHYPNMPLNRGWVGLIPGVFILSCRPPALQESPDLQAFYARAAEADLQAGLALLQRMDRQRLPSKDQEAFDCLTSRFQAPSPARPALPQGLARDVVDAYTLYWSNALRHPDQRERASQALESALRVVFERRGLLESALQSQKSVMDSLPPFLAKEGFHALTGKTAPLYELMLWKTEKIEAITVPLPGGPEAVEVVFLSDFVLRGWQAYATCGRFHSGGWTTPERVYCVEDAYDRNSEAFKVSLLAHEGQHHADLRQFPDLPQEDLEYRAKLVELALAEETQPNLLAGFASRGRSGSPSPHSRAEHRVIENLLQRLSLPWAQASRNAIRQSALALLESDTQKRRG